MPFHLPLAADWGDLIFLVVVLVGGLVQWIGSLKKKAPPEEADPSYPPPFGGPQQSPADHDAEPTWDELMDALGRKSNEAPPPIPTTPPAPMPVPQPAYIPPPPIPTSKTERTEPTTLATPFRTLKDQEPTERDEPVLSDHLKALLAAMDQPRPLVQVGQSHGPTGNNLLDPRKPGDVPTVTGRTNTRFGRLLHEPGQVRRAIVLQEILQPPLALR
jgi:hypothetical protein